MNIKILLIERNKNDYLKIKLFLQKKYNKPIIHHVFNCVDSFIFLSKPFKYDIILFSLPKQSRNRIFLTKSLSLRAKGTPIITLSEIDDPNLGIKSLNLGATNHLNKNKLSASYLSKSIYLSIKQQRIQSKILNSEKLYRQLFYLSPVPMWVYDTNNFQLLDINEVAVDLLGFSEKKISAMTILDFIPNLEKESVNQTLQEIQQKPRDFRKGIYSIITQNGNEIKVEIDGRPIDFGNHQARVAVAKDITGQLANLKLLKKTNKKLQTAQEIGKTGYWEMYLDTEKVYWSKELYKILEMGPNQGPPTNETYFSMIHPRDREKFNKSRKQLLSDTSKKKFSELEIWITCGNKQKKYVYQKTFLIKKNGLPFKLEGILRDITSQKKERERSELFESVITNTKDGVIITDNNINDQKGPKIQYGNEAFTQITGYTQEEIVGQSPEFLLGSNQNNKSIWKLKKSLKKGTPCQIEIVNFKKNGEAFWNSVAISPVENEYEGITHWIANIRDITPIKNYIKTIESQNKKLKEIAWTQSHITRTPLARIMGIVNLLCDSLNNPSETQDLLPLLEQSTNELDQVFRKINKMTSNIDNI
ncbi:PAS domain S-box protein [Echinicola jeungdonensis]|uniref:histidine kinase n=1 Tax=Echinicola jeungdonensis TaxID=709343 RepID=A0ABV5J2E7_9BACT|nr:PAS domain S-box protein [Echinicola jeungdonensis]MDN3668785.1 PAS domain S-box protein [Echinicola jeungdonensis]